MIGNYIVSVYLILLLFWSNVFGKRFSYFLITLFSELNTAFASFVYCYRRFVTFLVQFPERVPLAFAVFLPLGFGQCVLSPTAHSRVMRYLQDPHFSEEGRMRVRERWGYRFASYRPATAAVITVAAAAAAAAALVETKFFLLLFLRIGIATALPFASTLSRSSRVSSSLRG